MSNPGAGLAPRAAALIRSLIRLPDLRASIEALALFVAIVAAGALATRLGVLTLDHAPPETMSGIFLTAFFLPALAEEIAFRGWLRDGEPLVAGASMVAFVLWRPVQYLLGAPLAHPSFIEPGFLALVALLGFACTLSRLRSGSIWPGVIIHWGAAVVWLILFAGPAS